MGWKEINFRYATLNDYVQANRNRIPNVCAFLGIRKGDLSAILSGHGRPSFDLILRIRALTGIPLPKLLIECSPKPNNQTTNERK